MTIKLSNAPLTIEFEGADEEMLQMVEVISQTLEKLRKIWLDTLKRQIKLKTDASP